MPQAPTAPPPGITWRWDGALYGALCALPAAVVALSDAPKALAFAVGVLPAAIVGIAPRRRRRGIAIVLGALMGLSMLVGALLAGNPPLAVATVFGLAVGASALATRRPQGMLLLTLAVPLVGVGLSYTDPVTIAGLAVLFVVGSAYAALVAMAWPERPPGPARAVGPTVSLIDYGVRLGAAGATAAAIGFAAGWEHVGWATAACMLVMRPAPDLVTARGLARLTSVVVGAVVGVLLAETTSSGAVYAVAIVLVLSATAATRGSRWYITSAFTTFLVLSLLSYGTGPAEAVGRLNERVAETALGVVLAFAFGTLLPRLLARRRTPA